MYGLELCEPYVRSIFVKSETILVETAVSDWTSCREARRNIVLLSWLRASVFSQNVVMQTGIMSALCCTPFFLFVCLVLENRRQVHITAGSGETVCL